MFKSKKYSQSLLPSKSTRSTQSRSSTEVSVKPIDPPCNLSSSKGQDRPRVTKESQNRCDPLPYTSLAEEWENYKTLLLFIQPSNLDMNQGNIRRKKSKGAKRNLSSSKGQGRPRMTKESQDKCDSVLYTSLAEERENFETLLLFIQPSNAPRRDLLPKKKQPCNPELSELPSARYTLPPKYADD